VKRLLLIISIVLVVALTVVAVLLKGSFFKKTETIEYGMAKAAYSSTEPRSYTPDIPKKNSVDSVGIVVKIASVLCPTADTMGFRILLGLSMCVADSLVCKEIKEKEEGIVRLIQFTSSKLLPSQIEAERLKELLLERINGYLLAGHIKEIKFTQFDIVPPETP
jgi:flagellar basal body-associated protein FliL